MQFNQVLNNSQVLVLIFITFCLETTLSARIHQKGRSASLRIFPLNQRLTEGHERSASIPVFDKAADQTSNGEQGRGLMKKFLLFKSLFTQQKSEPSNNIIIITQPADTETRAPTTTGTTGGTTTTTALNDPLDDTPSSPPENNTGRGNEAEHINAANAALLDNLENSQPEEIVQQLLKQTKTNKKRLKKFNRKNLKNHKQHQRLRGQRNKRKRFKNRMPFPEKQTANNASQLPNNMQATKKPNQQATINKHNISSNNDNNNNMVAGTSILNFNTNMRLQNIMNAFRKQTPIMYNY